MKKNYASPRLTIIQDQIEELKIDTEVLIASEEVMVSVTKEGYIKRTSLRSYGASKPNEIGIKEGDYPLYIQQLNTLNYLLIFTSKGNIIYRPVNEISDLRWKDMGEHLSQNIAFSGDETVVNVFGITQQLPQATFTFITKEGYIKQTAVSEYVIGRNYKNKSFSAIKLKTSTDELINIIYTENPVLKDVFLVTHRGFGLRYSLEEVPVVGSKAAGVKSINLKEGDYVVNGVLIDVEAAKKELMILTHRGSIKK